MEMDTITTWNSYLEFRERWKGLVKFPSKTDSLVSCLPRYYGYISKLQTKIFNDNMGYKIDNKTYIIYKNSIILFKEDYKITTKGLDLIVSSNKKIKEFDYKIFPKKITNTNLESRFSDNNSPIDHSPYINDPIPAYDFCSDSWDDDPDTYYCRERLMRSHLTDIFALYVIETGEEGNSYEIAFEQDYWVDFYRNIGGSWFHNDVDLIEMWGNITGKAYLYIDYQSYYLGSIDMQFETYAENDDRLGIGIVNYFGFSLNENSTLNSYDIRIYPNKLASYFGGETLSNYWCNGEHVELECNIFYP